MDILELFSGRAWQHLITALLHTIWQGAVLALLLSAALGRLPARRPEARYLLSLTAQFAILLAGLGTWSILEYEPDGSAAKWTGPGVLGQAHAGETRPLASSPVARASLPAPRADREGPRWVSVLAMGWLAGVAVMLGRTAGSVWSAARLARGPRVSDPAVLAMIGRVRDELGIGRLIRAVEAAEECGPAILGVLWPTLLLPASAMTGLPADTLRAILIHELAHVRRFDYLVNLVQMVVESVLFFNPSVWWLGRQARLEREACCDAAAVRLTGGRSTTRGRWRSGPVGREAWRSRRPGPAIVGPGRCWSASAACCGPANGRPRGSPRRACCSCCSADRRCS
jgi:hypothetical protein